MQFANTMKVERKGQREISKQVVEKREQDISKLEMSNTTTSRDHEDSYNE